MKTFTIQDSTHPKNSIFSKVPSSITFHQQKFDTNDPQNSVNYPPHNHHVLHRDNLTTGDIESNARIVTWSDGSKQLWIGNHAVADVQIADVRPEHRHIYLKQNNDQFWLHYHSIEDTAIFQAKSTRAAQFTVKERKQTKMEVVENTSESIRKLQIDARNEEIRMIEEQSHQRNQKQDNFLPEEEVDSIFADEETSSIFDSLGVDPTELEDDDDDDIDIDNDDLLKT